MMYRVSKRLKFGKKDETTAAEPGTTNYPFSTLFSSTSKKRVRSMSTSAVEGETTSAHEEPTSLSGELIEKTENGYLEHSPKKPNGFTKLLRKLTFGESFLEPRKEEVVQSRWPNDGINYISSLPVEVLVEIFGNLRFRELYAIALVSKEFYALAKDGFLWRQLYRARWSGDNITAQQVEDWRALVKQRVKITERWKKGKTMNVRTLTSPDTHRVWSVQLDQKKLIAGSTSNTLQIWNLENFDEEPKSLKGHTAEVRCHHFLDGRLVSGGYDSTVRIWDLKEEKCLRALQHKADVYDVQIDSEKVVSCTRDSLVRLWDIETGQNLMDLRGHTLCLRALSFDRNLIMSAGEDKVAKVWDARSHDCIATLDGHKNGLTSLQFDDTKIVTGSFDTTVKMWDMRSGYKCYLTLQVKKPTAASSSRFYYHSPQSVWALQFDEDKVVTAHADHSVRVWDVNSGAELATLRGHTGEVITLHATVDRLVTGSEDRTIRVWDFSDS